VERNPRAEAARLRVIERLVPMDDADRVDPDGEPGPGDVA